MRVLIIEDDKEQSSLLAKLLRKVSGAVIDLEFFFAPTLEQGIRVSSEIHADITFLDPGLPDVIDMEGYDDVCEAIQTKKLHEPVFITTGISDPYGRLAAKFASYGAEKVFFKPYGENIVALMVSIAAGVLMKRRVAEHAAEQQAQTQTTWPATLPPT